MKILTHAQELIYQLLDQMPSAYQRQSLKALLYLPPYSPDLNPIEKCWSWLKSWIRKCLGEFDTLREAMEYVLDIAS